MTQLELFQTYFGFRLSHLVFTITEQVSLFLQSKTVILQDAVGQVNVARRSLERQRTEEAYNLFYQNCLNDSNTLTIPPCLLVLGGNQEGQIVTVNLIYLKLL